MALILPRNCPPPADPAAAALEATLAGLPDEWTLLPGRRIGRRDGPLVAFTLIHPEIGIALVDLAPALPERARDRLEDLLAEERIIGLEDTLPCVAVAIPAAAIDEIGERLAEAFDNVQPCDVGDPGWAGRVTELLLDAEDAAMAPLAVREPEPLRYPETVPQDDYEDARTPIDAGTFVPDEPMPLSLRARGRGWLTAGYAAALALLVVGGAVGYIVTEPSDTPAPTAAVNLPPLPPPTPPTRNEATARLDPLPPPPSAPAPSAAPEPPPQTAEVTQPPVPKHAPDGPAPAQAAAAPVVAPVPSPPAPPPAEVAPPAPVPVKATPAPEPKPPEPKPFAKPVRKAAVQAAPPAKAAAPDKRVAALEDETKARVEPRVEPRRTSDTGAARRARAESAPPIDAGDLPPLDAPPPPPSQVMATDLAGASVPPPNNFTAGPPAAGRPVSLLPPIAPPVAMPGVTGPAVGGFVGSPSRP